MSLNKTEYIIRQLAKTNKKNYENYVISRIWHLLDDLNIKIVTQQHVTTENGRALTDLYFPQLQFHVEVDEGQHFNRDGFPTTHHIAREADIVNATNHVVKRINVAKVCIDKINEEIATIVNQIKADFKKKAPTAWDIDAEFNPDTYIQKRKILVEDNVVLKKHVDVCKCFGLNYKRHQRGDAKHLKEKDTIIWFPKLYDNGVWKNSISDDEKLISEELVSSNKKWNNNLEHLKYALKHNNQNRIVFAHSKNNLGESLYRFKGVFKLNIEKSNSKQKCIYDRIAVEIDLSNFSQ